MRRTVVHALAVGFVGSLALVGVTACTDSGGSSSSSSSSSGATSTSSSTGGTASSVVTASSAAAASSAGGASSGTTAPVVSGCAAADYVDQTTVTTFSVTTTGNNYTPKCVKVKSGVALSIAATSIHPLQGQADVNGVANPFRAASAATSLATQTLTATGYYGFYCTNHGTSTGGGMAGAIWVVP